MKERGIKYYQKPWNRKENIKKIYVMLIIMRGEQE